LFFGEGPPPDTSQSGFNLALDLTVTADLGDPPTLDPSPDCPSGAIYHVAQSCSEASQPPDMPVPSTNVCDGERWSYYMNFGLCLYINTIPIFCSTDFAVVTGESVLGGLAVPTLSSLALGFNCTNHAKGFYVGLSWDQFPF
jgi:hypothetical protein